MIDRDFCLLDNISNIEDLEIIKNFPIYMGCVDTPADSDKFYDQYWGVSSKGLVQLKKLIDPDLLYENSHTPGTIGRVWKDHHKRFFDFISSNSPVSKNYLEIGGATGSLWDNFSKLDRDFNYTIIEPSNQISTDDRLSYLKGYYETEDCNKQYDCIIHSHLFEHVYNPIKFLEKIFGDLKNDGIHFISIPNMRTWLKKVYTNTLNFEHTFYVDEFVLEYFLSKCGFEISKKVVDEHSVFIKSVKTDSLVKVDFDFSYIKSLFVNYINSLRGDVNSIKEKIGENKIYLFGAHIFSQTILHFGLDQDHIISILDNDPKKQKRRLYGTSIHIESPEVLRDIDNPIVVLRAGVYSDEIKSQIMKINSSSIII